MSLTNMIRDLSRESKKPKEQPVKPVFDSAVTFDDSMVLDMAMDYTEKDIKIKSLGALHYWLETDDLDEEENMALRLQSLLIGIADPNKDGEITEDDQEVLDIALNCVGDYLEKYDIDDSDIDLLINDWDADAAERIRDFVAASMPDGDEAEKEMDGFVFDTVVVDNEDEVSTLDAVYKKKIVVRKGKKVRINKRIAGKVRLSARQKVAIKKAQMKSHRSGAMMRRKKSNKLRKNSGL